VRLRDEAVVGRVVNRRIQNAVEHEQPGALVELVLELGSLRDLDHCGDEVFEALGH
jgi:hypothetical protein